MREFNESSEAELPQFEASEWLKGQAEILDKALSEGISPDTAIGEVARPVAELALFGLESLDQLVEAVSGLLAAVEVSFDGSTNGLKEGLQAVLGVLGEGLAWLREHPDVLKTACELVVIAALALTLPEAFFGLLATKPGLVVGYLAHLQERHGSPG